MRISFLTILFVTISSVSFADKDWKPDFSSIKKNTVTKEEYLERKERALKNRAQILSDSRVRAFKSAKKTRQNQNCSLHKTLSEKSRCHLIRLKRESMARLAMFKKEKLDYLSILFRKIDTTFSLYAHRATSFYTSEINPSNIPPNAGRGIYAEYRGNGDRPEMVLRTWDPMVDPDGTITEVRWDFLYHTMTVPVSELNSNAEVKYYRTTTDHIPASLTIFDNSSGSTKYTTYTETDYNRIAKPTFTLSATSGAIPLTVNFTGTGESPEDEETGYFWSFGNGSGGVGSSVQHTYTTPGVYEVALLVTDARPKIAYAFATVYAGVTPPPGGSAPSGIIETNETFGQGPFEVFFDGSHSFDVDGAISKYTWDFGDYDDPMNFAEGPKATHVYKRPGTYTATLILEDDFGQTSYTTIDIYVTGSGLEATQIVAFQNTSNPLEIDFDASVTSLRRTVDKNSYYWNFGDSSIFIKGEKVSHTYSAPGTYIVTLHGRDVRGQYLNIQKTITVGSSLDQPEPYLTAYLTDVKVGEEFTLDGYYSSDPQSQPLEFRWDLGNGDQLEGTDLVLYKYYEPGVYPVEFLVTNSRGISKKLYETITVSNSGVLKNDFRVTPTIGVAPLSVKLDATYALQDLNTEAEFEWSLDGRQFISKKAQTEYTFTTPGDYEVFMSARDESGNAIFAKKIIRVLDSGSIPPGNLPPVAVPYYWADIYSDPESYYVYTECFGSYDPDDSIWSCSWKVNGIPYPDAKYFSFETKPNTRSLVELTVTDQWGAQNKAAYVLDFTETAAPILSIESFPLKPVVNNSIRFFGGNTYIPNTSIANYSWDFGDGSSAVTGVEVNHVYSTPGTYTVTLTITDLDTNQYTVSKNISVLSTPTNPVLYLSAWNHNGTKRVGGGETYTANFLNENIRFSVRGTSDSMSALKDASWDFGDGEIGFGTEVEHTYKQPGTYNVTVTGFDKDNRSGASSLIVQVDSSLCTLKVGTTMCPSLQNAEQNVLPGTKSSWVIGHNISLPNGIYDDVDVVLKSLDGSEKVINVTTETTIDSDKLRISKEKILDKGLDLSLPYKLEIYGRDTLGQPIIGELANIYFGTSSLNIAVNEPNVRLELINSGAQWKKHIDLQSQTEFSFKDVPPGTLVLIAEKNGKKSLLNIELAPEAHQNITFDMAASAIAKRDKALEEAVARRSGKGSVRPMSSMESDHRFGESLCGESQPFSNAVSRNISAGQSAILEFSSFTPAAQNRFQGIEESMGRPVVLSCGVSGDGLIYGYNKWKFKEGPRRCWSQEGAHPHWSSYLESLKSDSKPTVIKYEIRDAVTGESYTDHIVISPREAMARLGLNLNDLTWQLGLPLSEESDWTQRLEYRISVPPSFTQPEIRFLLIGPENLPVNSLYTVSCDVRTSNALPKITDIRSKYSGTFSRSARNGELSLIPKFGFMPVHYDNRSTSTVALDSAVGKATYEVLISSNGRSDISWQGVELNWKYGENSFTKFYSFSGAGQLDAESGNYRNSFEFDTADIALELGTPVKWDPGNSMVEVTVAPVGTISSMNDFTGAPKKLLFNALFDIQTLVEEQNIGICAKGFYPQSLTTFAQASLVNILRENDAEKVSMRCGNASLPFGGPIDLPSLSSQGNTDGRDIRIRTFNENLAEQDSYDDFDVSSPDRVFDLERYLEFSDAVSVIASETNEEIGGVPTDKKKLLNFCSPDNAEPKPPCASDTTFQQLDKGMILKICQWYGEDLNPVPGCPNLSLEPIIRLAKWAQQNSEAIRYINEKRPLSSVISSGPFVPVFGNSALDWQKSLLLKGTWPDSYPIWKIDIGSSGRFLSEPISSCAKDNICEFLSPIFTNDSSNFDSMHIRAGWR